MGSQGERAAGKIVSAGFMSRCSLQCLGLGGGISPIKVHEWIQDSGAFRSWTIVVEKILASPEEPF